MGRIVKYTQLLQNEKYIPHLYCENSASGTGEDINKKTPMLYY